MSFILDALKKSEGERQRQAGPSLADTPLRRAQVERPWWAVAVAALLIVNLGVLMIVLLRDNAAPAPAAMPSPGPANGATAAARGTMAAPELGAQPALLPGPGTQPVAGAFESAPSPAVHSLADAAGNAPGSAADRALLRPIQPPAVTPLPFEPTLRSAPATTAEIARSEAQSDEGLPTAGDLTASGTRVPDLKLDIHVFSKNPAERFVFVNMRKYLEGQTLQEGPAIEKITVDGIVLNQQGLRYTLPRQ